MKGQLYICGENLMYDAHKCTTIILVSGILKGGSHKGELYARLVASGSLTLLGIQYLGNLTELPSIPYFLPSDYLTHQPIYSSRWSGNDIWHPISVVDLTRYINLPKKSILFDKILSGDYKRI